jgi:hypothetical protein
MARGGCLLCLGGLDRTGNTAVIEGALALAIPAFPALGERGAALSKACFLVGLFEKPLSLTPT